MIFSLHIVLVGGLLMAPQREVPGLMPPLQQAEATFATAERINSWHGEGQNFKKPAELL